MVNPGITCCLNCIVLQRHKIKVDARIKKQSIATCEGGGQRFWLSKISVDPCDARQTWRFSGFRISALAAAPSCDSKRRISLPTRPVPPVTRIIEPPPLDFADLSA